MDDRFKPAVKQLPTEARLRSNEAGGSGIVRVDDEYADEFNLNDIGLAIFVSTYRGLA
jgi:hypothetical protein